MVNEETNLLVMAASVTETINDTGECEVGATLVHVVYIGTLHSSYIAIQRGDDVLWDSEDENHRSEVEDDSEYDFTKENIARHVVGRLKEHFNAFKEILDALPEV